MGGILRKLFLENPEEFQKWKAGKLFVATQKWGHARVIKIVNKGIYVYEPKFKNIEARSNVQLNRKCRRHFKIGHTTEEIREKILADYTFMTGRREAFDTNTAFAKKAGERRRLTSPGWGGQRLITNSHSQSLHS